jgi:hypothetical protein
MSHRRKKFSLVVAVAMTIPMMRDLPTWGQAEAPQTFHDGFETPRAVWRQEATDATIRLLAHDRSNRARHDGERSERFHFLAGHGSEFFYSYALPKIPVTDSLRIRLSVRSNRPGVQLFARVILPADTDPETKQPTFLMVPGSIYENGGRWQRIELAETLIPMEQQARVIRATTKRPVSIQGAYVERLVVNLYGGEGETEVFLDNLTITPVPPEAVGQLASADAGRGTVGTPRVQGESAPRARTGRVQFQRGELERDGSPWAFTVIRAPGADVAALRRAGFGVFADDLKASSKRWEEAARAGFLLMPSLAEPGGEAPAPAKAVEAATAFPFRDSVAFWSLGEGLGRDHALGDRQEELDRVHEIIAGLRGAAELSSSITTATVAGDFPLYARPPTNLDLLGVRPESWGGSLNPTDTQTYLGERRRLAAQVNPNAFFWAWIPTTARPELTGVVWGAQEPPPWGFPEVQPDQIRMQAYVALAAGFRGLGFLGDSGLTDTRGRGGDSRVPNLNRAILNELTLLNEEIDLIGAVVALNVTPILTYPTFPPDPPLLPVNQNSRPNQRLQVQKEVQPHPDLRAAAIELPEENGRRMGSLLVINHTGWGGQYQPPQMSVQDLKVRVVCRDRIHAFEINPGGLSVIDEVERVTGGTRVTLPEFSGTALVLLTTEPSMAEQIDARLRPARPAAVQLAIEQAELLYAWVTETARRLDTAGVKLLELDSARAFQLAARRLKSAYDARDREDYAAAWTNARGVAAPLRVLMRGYWDRCIGYVDRASKPQDQLDEEYEDKIRVRPSSKPKRERHKDDALVVTRPSSCPAAIAFNTLPALVTDWLPRIRAIPRQTGENLLPTGSFDDPDALKEAGWTDQSYHYDRINTRILTEPATKPRPGAQVPDINLKLVVEPADLKAIDTLPPFLDYPAAAVQTPPVAVRKGDFLRISVLVKRVVETPTGMGGVIIRDSIGGEPLQVRITEPLLDWTRMVMYRIAPEDTDVTVTLGLAGFGKEKAHEAYFDDLKIEVFNDLPPAEPPNVAAPATSAGRPPAAAAVRPDNAPTRSNR